MAKALLEDMENGGRRHRLEETEAGRRGRTTGVVEAKTIKNIGIGPVGNCRAVQPGRQDHQSREIVR